MLGLAVLELSAIVECVCCICVSVYLDEIDSMLGTKGLDQLHILSLVTVLSQHTEVGLTPAKVNRNMQKV